MGVGGQRHDTSALPPGKTRYQLHRGLGGPHGPVWTGAEKSRPLPPGFDPRTVQPVASRYTDCAIPAPHIRQLNIPASLPQWEPAGAQNINGHVGTRASLDAMGNRRTPFTCWRFKPISSSYRR